MTENNSYVKWLSELNKNSGQIAGGKGANLAEMFNSKFPVPPAFVITTKAYYYLIESTGIKDKINEILDSIDVDDTKELEEKAKKIRELIIKTNVPEDLKEEIYEAYENLSIDKDVFKNAKIDALRILQRSYEPVFVAVRSSATTEDLADSSFAGQQETYLNIKGNSDLIEAVKKVFASLFMARAIYYRKKRGFSAEKFALAVVVQKMIDSEKSGVIFSKNPVTEDDDIIVEAVFGLGEGIVSGKIKPDTYEVSKELNILGKNVVNKKIALTRSSSGKTEEVKLKPSISSSQVLEDHEIKRLANYAMKLEEHYKKPQDIEFAIEAGEIYIVQTRPITTQAKTSTQTIKGEELLVGLGASPGIASGKVRIIHDLNELDKVQKGDILVTEMTNPDMVVTMQKSSAIVTDEGGLTSHAAIVSREMGIPAVVGTGDATTVLKEGQIVTVDGFHGKVYTGESEGVSVEIKPVVHTKTKIKVILDLPEAAERATKTKVDAIGLLRLEGIIATSGKHPNFFLKQNKLNEYTKILETGIEKISEHFKEIWVRTSDIRSDEYANLEGASKQIEINPMLGMHGVRFSLKNPKLMQAELKAIQNCADKFPNKKFGVMMPQIISAEEITETKKIAHALGMKNVKMGIMVETPAACLIIKDLLKTGIEFISFGTNDLTQFTLAIDRGNENVQYLYNELHPAVKNAITRVIRTCKEMNVESSICGQAGSNKEMVKFLVDNDIDSISVNADAAYDISVYVAELEAQKQNMLVKQSINQPNFSQKNPQFQKPQFQNNKTQQMPQQSQKPQQNHNQFNKPKPQQSQKPQQIIHKQAETNHKQIETKQEHKFQQKQTSQNQNSNQNKNPEKIIHEIEEKVEREIEKQIEQTNENPIVQVDKIEKQDREREKIQEKPREDKSKEEKTKEREQKPNVPPYIAPIIDLSKQENALHMLFGDIDNQSAEQSEPLTESTESYYQFENNVQQEQVEAGEEEIKKNENLQSDEVEEVLNIF